MPIDIEKLKASDAFKKLPPDKQDLALKTAAKLSPAAAPAPSAPAAPAPRRIGGNGGPDATGRVVGRLRNVAQSIGGPMGPVAETAVGLLPQTNIQAAIDAAMLAPVGGEVGAAEKGIEYLPRFVKPIARLAARVAKPAIAGAIGGATEGKAAEGAESGAAQALGGEAIAGVGQLGKRTLAAADVGRIGNWIGEKFPAIGKISDVPDLDRMFRGGEGVDNASAFLKRTKTQIADSLGGKKLTIQIPKGMASARGSLGAGSLPVSVSFSEADKLITEMNDLGWTLKGDPKTVQIGKTIREMSHSAVQDLATALDEHQAGLGKRYLDARGQFSAAKTMSRMFSEKGVIDEAGNLNMSRLQSLASEGDEAGGYRRDLDRALGGKADDFLKQVFRGAPPTARDVPGAAVNIRSFMHPGGTPGISVHPPTPPTHVGEVPVDLGRGRSLAAILTLGPSRLLNVLFGSQAAPQQSSTPTAR